MILISKLVFRSFDEHVRARASSAVARVWRDSCRWGRRRRCRRPRCRFQRQSTKPNLLRGPKGKRIHLRAQTNPAAFEPRKMDDDDDEVELRNPRSFSFEDVGGGVAQAAGCGYRRCVRCGRHARELVAAHVATMRVRTRDCFRFGQQTLHL